MQASVFATLPVIVEQQVEAAALLAKIRQHLSRLRLFAAMPFVSLWPKCEVPECPLLRRF
jgi:hypothetical protein